MAKYSPLILSLWFFGVVLLQVCVTGPAGSVVRSDLFEWHLGRSAIIPDFQKYPGNGALAASISFSKVRKNCRGPDQANKVVEDHSHVF